MSIDRDLFREKLESLIDEIDLVLGTEDDAESSIEPDRAIGRLTRMEALQAQAMGQEGRRRLELRRGQVLRALDRIEKGTYGRCARCGSDIPAGRLEAMPEAALCVSCAARAR